MVGAGNVWLGSVNVSVFVSWKSMKGEEGWTKIRPWNVSAIMLAIPMMGTL